MFAVKVPSLEGYSTELTISTCDNRTKASTHISAYEHCPDPWAAAADTTYYDRALAYDSGGGTSCGADEGNGGVVVVTVGTVNDADVESLKRVCLLVSRSALDLSLSRDFHIDVTCQVVTPKRKLPDVPLDGFIYTFNNRATATELTYSELDDMIKTMERLYQWSL